MLHTMEQSLTLGAYAGTVTVPLVATFGDADTQTRVRGLVQELWAGLPLVDGVSHVEEDLPLRDPERTITAQHSPDGATSPQTPADLVPDCLDLVRTLWLLTRDSSPMELATVARFRLADLAAAMDHLYATRRGEETPPRPGTFETVIRECLDIIAGQRATPNSRLLGDSDLYEHGLSVGQHLVDCLSTGQPCLFMTMPQIDLLRLQVMSALSVAGLQMVSEGDLTSPGVLLEVIDDVDLRGRHIELHWHCSMEFRQRCREALANRDLEAEVLRHSGRIHATMSHALQEILSDAGFETSFDPDLGEHQLIVSRLVEPEALNVYIGSDTLT